MLLLHRLPDAHPRVAEVGLVLGHQARRVVHVAALALDVRCAAVLLPAGQMLALGTNLRESLKEGPWVYVNTLCANASKRCICLK